MADPVHRVVVPEPKWGRVLLCGGTDWAALGRSRKAGGVALVEDRPDLTEPYVLRSLANVRAVSVHTSHSGCHAVILDVWGTAYLFGRNASSCLGLASSSNPTISERTPYTIRPSHIGASPDANFVSAACGRAHTLLITDAGEVYSAGINSVGQCGHSPRAEVQRFKRIKGPWSHKDKAVSAAAGITFSLVLTESGKVYTFGSAESGQLGNGRTGERISTGQKSIFDVEWEPILVEGLQDRKIVQISCGQQHSLVLDADGMVFAWGNGGYSRMGLGNPKDQLVPVTIPKFASDNKVMRGERVIAGPTSSAVVDGQGMYWLAGKWKMSGDGSSGQPYSTFRYFQEISTCRILGASSGGVTQFCFCNSDEENGIMTIAWGQNALHYELGLGEDNPKSSTKPVEVTALNGIEVFQIAAGAHSTFFLAKPNDKLSDLTRYPDVESSEDCVVCHTSKGDDETLLECEKCESPYHLPCLTPPLTAVPDGEWFCHSCNVSSDSRKVSSPNGENGRKRARELDGPSDGENGSTSSDDGEGEAEEDDEDGHAAKRTKTEKKSTTSTIAK